MAKETINSSKEYKKLIIGISVIFGILILFIGFLSLPYLFGKTIVLKTMPVDPFDVFRGQYVVINYEISNIPAISGAREGQTVYVLLEEREDGIFYYKSAQLEKPEGIFIKGRVNYISNDQMRVEYGIEQYFFERGAEFQTRNMTVEAKVDWSGNSRISKLLQDGKPIEMKYRDEQNYQ